MTSSYTWWVIKLANNTMGIVNSATKPKAAYAVMIKGPLTQTGVNEAINQIPMGDRTIAGGGRGDTSDLIQNAIASARKTGTGTLWSAGTGKAAALAALGVFSVGLAGAAGGGAAATALGGGEAAADGETAAEDAEEGSSSSSGLNPGSAAKALEGGALAAFLAAWGPTRILKLVIGVLLLLLALKQITSLGTQGAPSA